MTERKKYKNLFVNNWFGRTNNLVAGDGRTRLYLDHNQSHRQPRDQAAQGHRPAAAHPPRPQENGIAEPAGSTPVGRRRLPPGSLTLLSPRRPHRSLHHPPTPPLCIEVFSLFPSSCAGRLCRRPSARAPVLLSSSAVGRLSACSSLLLSSTLSLQRCVCAASCACSMPCFAPSLFVLCRASSSWLVVTRSPVVVCRRSSGQFAWCCFFAAPLSLQRLACAACVVSS